MLEGEEGDLVREGGVRSMAEGDEYMEVVIG